MYRFCCGVFHTDPTFSSVGCLYVNTKDNKLYISRKSPPHQPYMLLQTNSSNDIGEKYEITKTDIQQGKANCLGSTFKLPTSLELNKILLKINH